ncbi:MAG: exo-alpha-sialidase, partial [Desulfobacterales bacterium]
MTVHLYIATAVGLFIVTQTDGNWDIVRHALQEQSLTSIAVSESVILVGTATGIWRSTDHGQTWDKADNNLAIRHVRWMTASSQPPRTILVGTEPAGIFRSRDGGATWRFASEVAELRDFHGWFLPYSPKAGCVRGFAIAASGPDKARVYAAAEVGGVLVSDDGGETWQLVKGSNGKPDMNRELGTMVHPDVHSITVHPSSSDLVTAATGGGLYRSRDGGRSWKRLYRCYIRATWVDPSDPQHMIAGPADSVSRNGRIEESYDGGRTWRLAADGMKTPWARHMVERFIPIDKDLFAILSNGELWLKRLDGS